ncbi:hypothetical protein FRC05_001771 [Tulasnella sp. 425]|nr:hypothetical protein FRC05_001771 [Tulasnella sp. 425]
MDQVLLGVKAVPSDTSRSDFSFELMTEEEAEALSLEENTEALQSDRDATVDGEVDLGSSIAKRMEGFKKIVLQVEDERSQVAREHGQAYTPKKVLNLLLDVRTRWNSVLFMLERALRYREAIDALCDHSVWKIYSPYRLSQNEWEVVEMIANWLKVLHFLSLPDRQFHLLQMQVFRKASTKMSGDQYVTLSSSLAVYAALMSYVAKLRKMPAIRSSLALQNGLSACYEKLEKFYDKSTFETEYYYFATSKSLELFSTDYFSNFKDTLFKKDSDLFSEEWIKGCHDSFMDTLDRHYPPNPSQILPAPVQPLTDSMEIDEFDAELRALPPPPKEVSIPHRLELEQYLAEDITAAEPLDWWRVTVWSGASISVVM